MVVGPPSLTWLWRQVARLEVRGDQPTRPGPHRRAADPDTSVAASSVDRRGRGRGARRLRRRTGRAVAGARGRPDTRRRDDARPVGAVGGGAGRVAVGA